MEPDIRIPPPPRPPSTPYSENLSITVTNVTATSATLNWYLTVLDPDLNPIQVGMSASHMEIGLTPFEGSYFTVATYDDLTPDITSVTVTGLTPDFTYLPQIRSYNQNLGGTTYGIPDPYEPDTTFHTDPIIRTFSDDGTPNILSFLGFSDKLNVAPGGTVTATYGPQLYMDNALYLYLQDLRGSSLEPVQITFKVPMNYIQTFGTVSGSPWGTIYYTASKGFDQTVRVYDKTFTASQIRVQVRDRFGNIIDNNGIDWSFSLEIQSDT